MDGTVFTLMQKRVELITLFLTNMILRSVLDINSKGQGNPFLSDLFRLFMMLFDVLVSQKNEFSFSNFEISNDG